MSYPAHTIPDRPHGISYYKGLYRDQVTGKGKSEKVDTSSGNLDKRRGCGQKGKRPGSRGYGRRIHGELPMTIKEHELSDAELRCPICGLRAEDMETAEESEEVGYVVKLVRIRRRRKKYKRSCNCPGQAKILTARIPAKLLTIFATLNRNKMNVRRFLELYFDRVARNNGKAPESVDDILPWNLSPEVRALLQLGGPGYCRDP